MPEISVVMPVYNSAHSLPSAIESILSQTFQDFEFIIVNDYGSNDGSKECIERYAKKDKRIKLIQLEQRGHVGGSLNIGIECATGKYIARMDSDDYSYPNRFEVQWNYMENHPECVLCGSRARMIDKRYSTESEMIFPSDPEHIKAQLLFFVVILHPTIFFRREEFISHDWRYMRKLRGEDYELFTRVDGIMVNLPTILLDYMREKNSATIKYYDEGVRDYIYIVKNQLKQKFSIRVDQYEDEIFTSILLRQKEPNAKLTQNLYKLLEEIENKNNELKWCNPIPLVSTLCKVWNQYLFNMPTLSINDLLLSPECVQNSFVEALAQKFDVSIRDIPIQIARIIEAGKTFGEEFVNNNLRIVAFGCGMEGKRYFNQASSKLEHIVYFCDNDIKLHGRMMFGKKVISPSGLDLIDYDLVVITSRKYYYEISNQLEGQCHLSRDKIVPLVFLDYLS